MSLDGTTRRERFARLQALLAERIVVLDGAMGTMLQDYRLTEADYRGTSFTDENRLRRILNAIQTPIPGIVQAGQWTFSPSGFPISILTGKLAADRVTKELGKSQ